MNVRLFLNTGACYFFSFVCVICFTQKIVAQCSTPISAFPYTEGFEISNGGWTPGGALSDWAWGAPSKPVITGAASGIKCWIVGGLTGSSYNDAEASWLQSPCFDFTALQYPYISFAVFWETERRFDGANLQYSTNLGSTWTNVGSVADPVNCLNDNWFNYSPITYLNGLATVRDGWSGNIQTTAGSCLGGGGSGRWVAANHSMPYLAGLPNVIFRFTFGAGTQCNAYDGFAFDDFVLSEAPPNNASFTYSCINSTTINFTNTSGLCPTGTNWDFGDPASGSNNISTLSNPTHIFSAPGSYIITLNVTGPDNAPSITSDTINILGLSTSVLSNNNCAGDNNGSAIVNVVPVTAAPFFYMWNTTPAQNTQTATSLAGGIHTVTISAIKSCTSSATVVIVEPAALSHTVNIIQPGCSVSSGTATISMSGGTAPYTYSWFPSGGTGPSASGLTPGNYTVTVTDSKLCTHMIDIVIANATTPSIVITNKKNVTCFGLSDGSATAQVLGGSAPYIFNWTTNPVQTNATANNLATGNYTVTVTDNNGCIASATVVITEPASGSCGDVYFPNAFTPNSDSRNDDFGAMGNIAALSNYLLLIYNRYGELVFYSRSPSIRWDGYYKGKIHSGTYIWTATFIFKGQTKREEKGSVTIIK